MKDGKMLMYEGKRKCEVFRGEFSSTSSLEFGMFFGQIEREREKSLSLRDTHTDRRLCKACASYTEVHRTLSSLAWKHWGGVDGVDVGASGWGGVASLCQRWRMTDRPATSRPQIPQSRAPSPCPARAGCCGNRRPVAPRWAWNLASSSDPSGRGPCTPLCSWRTGLLLRDPTEKEVSLSLIVCVGGWAWEPAQVSPSAHGWVNTIFSFTLHKKIKQIIHMHAL